MYINISSDKIKNVRNLVLDYDKVLKFNSPELTSETLLKFDELLKKINDNGQIDKFVIHINSLRGMSFFDEIKFWRFILSRNKVKVYFSGCGGAFCFDLTAKTFALPTVNPFPSDVVHKIASLPELHEIVQLTGQDDELLWRKYAASDYELAVEAFPQLYWDWGYPGSKGIYKCAVNLNEEVEQSKIESIKSALSADLNISVTSDLLEFTLKEMSKGVAIKKMLSAGCYVEGTIVAIGDQPGGADKAMLEALPEIVDETNDYRFFGLTNACEEVIDTKDDCLAGNIQDLFKDLNSSL